MHINNSNGFIEVWEKVFKDAKPIQIGESEIKPVIEGAPINLRIPMDFVLTEDGIFTFDEKKGIPKRISRTPILITKRLVSMESNEEKLEIEGNR